MESHPTHLYTITPLTLMDALQAVSFIGEFTAQELADRMSDHHVVQGRLDVALQVIGMLQRQRAVTLADLERLPVDPSQGGQEGPETFRLTDLGRSQITAMNAFDEAFRDPDRAIDEVLDRKRVLLGEEASR